MTQSGLGREGSAEGLDEHQEIRFYNIARRSTH
jgi:succinate-semialdehyde dehydrogenase/glutarate-semialdehyde dehydrogenase